MILTALRQLSVNYLVFQDFCPLSYKLNYGNLKAKFIKKLDYVCNGMGDGNEQDLYYFKGQYSLLLQYGILEKLVTCIRKKQT